ncbi:MAG: tetraacyldisaccharide 4'-kinase [Planktomarina sp.]|nr:tetraacyldisaccharide 4'-kinase [Planktomarina sp.]|tara:strand:+ start:1098 stop:2075 length:978 start_codon:yes stop_codon:yes gene_type:complete
MTHTPKFWYQPRGMMAFILRPLGMLYAAATACRQRRDTAATPVGCPVICIGNINVGGMGKTPVTIAMVEYLQGRGQRVVVLSRGYGGTVKAPTLVNPEMHGAGQVGDEPLLVAAFCLVVVSRKRVTGLELASAQNPDVILLDDGFQDPSIRKDFSIVVVNAALGFGNGLCIPAGPLREPSEVGLKRADLCISIGGDVDQKRFKKPLIVPHLTAEVKPLLTGMSWQGVAVFAFAGIAHPEKFFETLRGLGAKILGYEALSDHQPLSASVMKRLTAKAKSLNAQLVCTEKDAARLPADYRLDVLTLPVRLEITDWSKIDAKLADLGL